MAEPNATDILTAARALLAPAGAWCQHATHKVLGPEIRARDIVTALWAGGQQCGLLVSGSPASKAAYQAMWDATGGRGIIAFNDDLQTTHERVLLAFDMALQQVRQVVPAVGLEPTT